MEDRIITLQKEIIEDLWVIRGILYQQLTDIEKKIKKLESYNNMEKAGSHSE